MYFSLAFLQTLYQGGLFLIVLLIGLDLLSFFMFPNTLLSDIFIATREQTPLTWLSAVALLLLAFGSLSLYFQQRRSLWYWLALAFFFLSIDDAIYLHERLAGQVHDAVGFLSAFPSYLWLILYLPLLLFTLGTLVYYLWQHTSVKRSLLVLILILLGGALLLDFVDGLMQKNPTLLLCLEMSCQKIVLHLMRLTEEVIEVVAIGMLGYSLIRTSCLKE